jgi:hypothetical protein
MRKDVAGAQHVQDLRHQLHRLYAADVAHDLGAAAHDLAGAHRTPERLQAMARDDILRHAHLDADGDIRVVGEHARSRFRLREVDVEQLADRKRGEADVGDMHEGVEPRARLRRHEAAVGGERTCARIAG